MNTKKRDEILSITLPVQEYSFLLPNVSIAEIFTLDMNVFNADRHNEVLGFIGRVLWRQSDLVVLNLNELVKQEKIVYDLASVDKPRIAVVNPISKPELPYYAILTTKTPRLSRLKSSDFRNYSKSNINGLSFDVVINGEQLIIPNLLFLENHASAIE